MRYKRLGKSSLDISVIGLGTWAMGGDFWGDTDDRNSINTIHAAIDNGVNFIDTAYAYGMGHAEKVIGKAIKGKRSNVIIATKCGLVFEEGQRNKNSSKRQIMLDVDNALRRLNIGCIDLMQVHWPDTEVPISEPLYTLEKAREAGKIRYIGISNYNLNQIEEASSLVDITSFQPQFSLIHRNEEKSMLYCKEKNIGVLTYGSLGGGILTGKFKDIPKFNINDKRAEFYDFFIEPMWSKCMNILKILRDIANERNVPISQVAINWVNQNSLVTSALAGMKTPEQALMNTSAGEWELTPEEINLINDSYNRIFS